MRVDLHCHTRFSPDSLTTCEALLRWMDRHGVDMVAITDHNTIYGALEYHAQAPQRFLVGEEINTAQGELIALFLREWVPPGLSLQETIARVRAQDGLIGASHPLDHWRGEALGRERLEAIHGHLDFLETFNARMTARQGNRHAHELAVRWGLPGSAGSDAHAPFEVGRAYVEMPSFDGQSDFLSCLAAGQIGGRLSSPLVHLVSSFARWRRRLPEPFLPRRRPHTSPPDHSSRDQRSRR
jgi:predicted metal-dependent phosphoesterase TrpH